MASSLDLSKDFRERQAANIIVSIPPDVAWKVGEIQWRRVVATTISIREAIGAVWATGDTTSSGRPAQASKDTMAMSATAFFKAFPAKMIVF